MTDPELDELFARYGVDLPAISEQETQEQPPGPELGLVGERQRDALLQRIGAARASLEMLEALLKRSPFSDHGFDAIDTAFGQNLEAARIEFQRFRTRRDCQGEA